MSEILDKILGLSRRELEILLCKLDIEDEKKEKKPSSSKKKSWFRKSVEGPTSELNDGHWKRLFDQYGDPKEYAKDMIVTCIPPDPNHFAIIRWRSTNNPTAVSVDWLTGQGLGSPDRTYRLIPVEWLTAEEKVPFLQKKAELGFGKA